MPKRFKALLFALTLVLLFALVFFTASKPERGDITTPEPGQGGTLVVGISEDIDTFNPLFAETAIAQQVIHLILQGLADLNEDSEFQPELATSWERSQDRLSVRYHIRRDAEWSDGRPVTAYDVDFTFELLQSQTLASPRQSVADYVDEVVVEDSFTVLFKFDRAYPDQVFDTAGEVLPAHIFVGLQPSDIRRHPFGHEPLANGPFRLHDWKRQEVITLVPNENYYGRRPYLDRVVFRIIPDKTSLYLQMVSGDVDMVVSMPPEQAARLRGRGSGVHLYPVAGRVYYYIGYNLRDDLFSDVRVRHALARALDVEATVDALLYGFGKVCLGPLPPMLKWTMPPRHEGLTYSLKSAKELMREAGWEDSDDDGWLDKDGKRFEFVLKTNIGNQLRSDVAVIAQQQFKKIGVDVKIETLELAGMIGQLRRNDFQAYMGGWSTSFNVDLTPMFHSASAELFNFGGYANPRVDSLIEVAREESNVEKGRRLWLKTQELIYADQPYTFLFWKDNIAAVHERFKNVTPIPLSTFYGLENWYEAN